MARQFRVYTGTPTNAANPQSTTSTTTPDAGGPVDTTAGGEQVADGAVSYSQGFIFRVDTGGSFSAGDALATDAQGRAVAAASGDVVVARALEGSSGAGDEAWVTWDRRKL